MKQQTMVAMMATNRRMEEAMPAKVVGLEGRQRRAGVTISLIPLRFREAEMVVGRNQCDVMLETLRLSRSLYQIPSPHSRSETKPSIPAQIRPPTLI